MSKRATAKPARVPPATAPSDAEHRETPQERNEYAPPHAESPDGSETKVLTTISLLDPRSIRPSAFANRHQRSFASDDFEKLKSSIAEVGGNIQAIKIRPIPSEGIQPADVGADPPVQFEVVFGHRRHRACLELGVPIAAVIEPMSDKALFAEMDRENRMHMALSPFEQGWMFKLALQSGLYPSARALAQDLGLDESIVSKSLTIARLPEEVIRAFVSPLDIQYRWAGPLNEAHRRDPAGLVARATNVQSARGRLNSVRIFQRLVAAEPSSREAEIHIAGRCGHASMEVDRKGRLAILIAPPWNSGLPKRVEAALREVLDEQ